MSRKNKGRPTARAEPGKKKRSCSVGVWMGRDEKDLACMGYTSLAHNPEVCTAVDAIARLMGSMTIHLMENTGSGDVRVQNELARKVDIEPNVAMTRSNFIHWIIKTLLIEGAGNAVTDSAGLAGNAAAGHPADDIKLAIGIGKGQRLTYNVLQRIQAEIIVDIPIIDGDLAGPLIQADSGDGAFPPSRAVKIGCSLVHSLRPPLYRFHWAGFCAACLCSAPA